MEPFLKWLKKRKYRIGGILLLIVLLWLPYLWGGMVYRSAIQNAKAKGFIFDLNQFAPASISDDENASPFLTGAGMILSTLLESGNVNGSIDKQLSSKLESFANAPSLLLSEDELDEYKNCLNLFSGVIKQVNDALECNHANFYKNNETISIHSDVPNYLHRKRIAQILRLQCAAALNEGEPEQAYQHVKNMIRFSRLCMEESPFLIGILIGLSNFQLACETLHQLECLHPPAKDDRNAIMEEIEALQLYERIIQCLNLEGILSKNAFDDFLAGAPGFFGDWERREKRSYLDGYIESITFGEMENVIELEDFIYRYPGRFWIRVNQGMLINYYSTAVELLHRPSCEIKETLQDYYEQSAQSELTKYMKPNFMGIMLRRDRAVVDIDFIRLSFALQNYKEENGEYPESLSALQSEFNGDLPIDPFRGEPYQYSRLENGYQIYSWGGNFKDDGGTNPKSDWKEEGDLVWTIIENQALE